MIGDLIVGDIHAKKTNLLETVRLWDWILNTASNKNARVILLGDIFNDFGVAHVEVLSFWAKAGLQAREAGISVLVVVGNHDMSPDGSYNFPAFLSSIGFNVYDKPAILGSDLFMPFYRNNDEFVKDLNNLCASHPQIKNVYCHQEFNGCQFENGFYAPHGVMPDQIPKYIQLISGHIHKQQKLGNIFYPGTPRGLTRSDANEIKGIFYWSSDGMEFIQTPESVCEPIKLFTVSDPDELASVYKQVSDSSSAKCYIDIVGDKKFVSDCLKKDWGDTKVKTIVKSDLPDSHVSESQGIAPAFTTYFVDYIGKNNLGKKEAEVIWGMISQYVPGAK